MPNQLQISCVCCGICFASFNPQKFCSGDCRRKYGGNIAARDTKSADLVINKTTIESLEPQKAKYAQTCRHCGTIFQERYLTPFCGKLCRQMSKAGAPRGMKIFNCKRCGKDFFSRIDRRTQEYCSGDCGFNAREEKIIQEWGEGDAF